MRFETKTLNRWSVVVGATSIQLALGAIYAWSVFTARLTDAAGSYAFTASQTAWVFSTGLATFATVMVLAGLAIAERSISEGTVCDRERTLVAVRSDANRTANRTN